MADKNYLVTGITELLILSILDKHDSYVYEITKNVSDLSGGLLSISQNTVYTATYKLETEGKISAYSKLVGKKRTRIYYRLEPDGQKYLEELKANHENMVLAVQNIFIALRQNDIDPKETTTDEQDL